MKDELRCNVTMEFNHIFASFASNFLWRDYYVMALVALLHYPTPAAMPGRSVCLEENVRTTAHE